MKSNNNLCNCGLAHYSKTSVSFMQAEVWIFTIVTGRENVLFLCSLKILLINSMEQSLTS